MTKAATYFLEEVQPELNHWALSHCSKFADVKDAEILSELEETEQNLDHYALFEEYISLFSSRMEWFLTLKDRTVEEFVAKCKEGEEIRALGLPVVDGQFLDLMKIIDDYPGFLVFMRDEYNEKVRDPESWEADMADFCENLQNPDAPKNPDAGRKFTKPRHIMPAAVTYFKHVVAPTLAQFANDHSEQFLSDELDQYLATGGTEGEHSLAHYDLFKQYTKIFEETMEGFFAEKGINLEDFVEKCKEAEKTRTSEQTTFLDVIAHMDSFTAFLKQMRKSNK
eukprot:CAMPEP_0197851146 /NCGR_PEP_ID=MMETSP1438-20131217/17375_1 /TAXON_ID=1461541 /ORGANISM="Pterosperma sp., Strain CCMP1384" /LENGTH=280 /DNA_ID=CAMNT_0043464645 /DNA_START=257 /DNA_END=1099 /DNA_ORIENTATION=+